MPTGRVGVDVSFVISGYLITSILLKEHTQGTYSLTNFYVRRVRRILPVLFISLAVFLS
jgi:peptidoglycan/LPS O-acetylase OafA/YrhL